MPRHYVEDYANVINESEERSLNGVLQELYQKTGAQYIVLTVLSAGGLPIEQFSIELAEKWKLGQKGKDNGMLFVLAKNDQKWRFEVGYGLVRGRLRFRGFRYRSVLRTDWQRCPRTLSKKRRLQRGNLPG